MKFTNKDTVCFFGDSITADGSWESEVFPYLNGAKIFNCGVPADDTNAAILRVYESCLIHNPTHVVMMLGANDNRADFYGENGRMQESFLDRYRNNMRKLIELFLKFGVKLILCTITPYDEYSEVADQPNLHLDIGCKDFREIIVSLAKEYNLAVVDFYDCMSKLLIQDGVKVICPDRLHPSFMGYHVMAQCFLKAFGFINEIDCETLPTFTGALKERLDLEQYVRNLKYVEYEILYPVKIKNPHAKHEEKMAYLEEQRLKYPENDYTRQCIESYLADSHNWRAHLEKYLTLTVEIAKAFEK
jgi:lysophospholipase L1-like esterase